MVVTGGVGGVERGFGGVTWGVGGVGRGWGELGGWRPPLLLSLPFLLLLMTLGYQVSKALQCFGQHKFLMD